MLDFRFETMRAGHVFECTDKTSNSENIGWNEN